MVRIFLFRLFISRCIVALLLSGLLMPARAEILFARPPLFAGAAGDSALFSYDGVMVAQPFLLEQASRISALRFYAGFDLSGVAPAAVSWSIRQTGTVDAHGSAAPGAVVAAGSGGADLREANAYALTVVNETPVVADFRFRFDLGLGLEGIVLDPAAYWLTLHVDEKDQFGGGIFWSGSSAGVQGAISHDSGQSWQPADGGLAFELAGDTLPFSSPDPARMPEPATVLLVGLGLLGLAIELRHFRHRRQAMASFMRTSPLQWQGLLKRRFCQADFGIMMLLEKLLRNRSILPMK